MTETSSLKQVIKTLNFKTMFMYNFIKDFTKNPSFPRFFFYVYFLKCLLSFYIIMLWPNHSGRTTILYKKDSPLTSFLHIIKSSSLIYTL